MPGKAEESLLIRAVQHREDDLAMPPKKPKLPDAIIADLVSWVKMRAPDPRDGEPVEAQRADKSWWSLQPLRAADPVVSAGSGAIDRYIEARLPGRGWR